MKKLILLIGLTLGVIGADSPYVGLGISASDAPGEFVSCRASTSLIGGVKFSNADFTFSVEGRSMNSFNGSYASTAAYIKPEYKGVYALVGYGRTNYTEHDIQFNGVRYGAGYDFGPKWKHLFVDAIYDPEANNYILTIGGMYYFETGF